MFGLWAKYAHGDDERFIGPVAILPIETPMAYITAVYVPSPPKPLKISKSIASSCVLYAKKLTGYSEPVGRAINWHVNSQVPEIGAVVVFKYSHVGVVTDIVNDTIEITEANYIPNKISSRSLQLGDRSIKGYHVF